MRSLRRLLTALAALAAFAGYLWFAAVRALPEVRRRKQEARLRRRRSLSQRDD